LPIKASTGRKNTIKTGLSQLKSKAEKKQDFPEYPDSE
jgi:hypothetical protein